MMSASVRFKAPPRGPWIPWAPMRRQRPKAPWTELPAALSLGPDEAGRVVDEALAEALGATPRFVAKLLRQGRVLVDGRALAPGERLPGAGRLEALPPLPGLGPRPPAPNAAITLVVRHEDADLV